jgi:hypothetical protein
MSSPRLRAAAFSSLVMLKTYAGSLVSLLNSSIALPLHPLNHHAITTTLRIHRSSTK